MKKILFAIIIVTISCSSNPEKPRDTTKMTYLDIGSFSLGIDKKFEMIGVLDSELEKENLDTKSSRIHSTEYLFADVSDGMDNIRKGLIVYDNQLKDPHHFWIREISYQNTKVSGKVDSGFITVGRVRMAYMLLKANPAIDQNITKVLAAKGPQMGRNLQQLDQVSMVYFARLISNSRNIVIVYIDGQANPELAFNESLNYLTLDD
jgi:hypothetical protein